MVLLIGVIIYVSSLYFGIRFTVNIKDKNKILNLKEKLLAMIWFGSFITGQFIIIEWVFGWLKVF